MQLLPLFRSSLSSALERQYLNKKWIGDQSLVTILQRNYGLEFVTKAYINKYLPNTYLDKYNCYHVRINGIRTEGKKVINATFYHFSKSDTKPQHLPTKREWEYVYNNFHTLRSPQNNNKRKNLQDVAKTTINNHTVEDEIEGEKKKTIIDEIGNYFNSPEALILFNCKNDELVDDCLSRRIDLFDDILNQRKSIEDVVNKSSEENGKLTSSQTILILQRIQYLRMAYLNVVNSNLNATISFKTCCDQAIKQMGEVGVKHIKNAKTRDLCPETLELGCTCRKLNSKKLTKGGWGVSGDITCLKMRL